MRKIDTKYNYGARWVLAGLQGVWMEQGSFLIEWSENRVRQNRACDEDYIIWFHLSQLSSL